MQHDMTIDDILIGDVLEDTAHQSYWTVQNYRNGGIVLERLGYPAETRFLYEDFHLRKYRMVSERSK